MKGHVLTEILTSRSEASLFVSRATWLRIRISLELVLYGMGHAVLAVAVWDRVHSGWSKL